jgi:DNA-binding NtrC family response regulator
MRPGVPSILVSGYGAGQLPPDAELPTDQRFLAKPFAMDELARAVDGALES